jgi:protein CMS1
VLATAIQDTTSWDKARTIENLPGFLEKFSGNSTKLWSASKKNGAPHTIIVTAAGLRAADLARYYDLSL